MVRVPDFEANGLETTNRMEIDMSVNYPVLPIAGGALVRAFVAGLSFVAHWLKQLARARRHRREAAMLAGLDRRMLSDIGITRSDLRDAFSEPFWEDPTTVLRARAIERRSNRTLMRADIETQIDSQVAPGFRRLSMDRPAGQSL